MMDARVQAISGRPSLLLVEDDEILSTVLARSFARHGFDVRCAHTAKEALQAASDAPPAHAVVDLKLPDGSGLEVVARLAALEARPRVVVLTGHGSIPTAVEAIKLGACYYLTKPATPPEIIAAFGRDTGDASLPISDKPMSVERLAWEHIQRVLAAHRGNVSATARALSMHRRTLQRKLAKHPVRA
jgi:two-component system response regulator RegA